jgi:hypothetical protein
MSYAPGKNLAVTVEAALKQAWRDYDRDMNNARSEVIESEDAIREAKGTIDAIGCPESTHMDWFNDLDDATGRRDRYISDMCGMKNQFHKTLAAIETMLDRYHDMVEDSDIPDSEY